MPNILSLMNTVSVMVRQGCTAPVHLFFFMLVQMVSYGQDARLTQWSDSAQYNAYLKGDWNRVIELGKQAERSGIDYYYIRARNGYAQFMLGRYIKAEQEFEKALHFNGADPFSVYYAYWSAVYAGNTRTAIFRTISMKPAERDSFKVMRPRWLRSVSAVGGYRLSSSPPFTRPLLGAQVSGPPGDMPYASLYLEHDIGRRFVFRHGVNYLQQDRFRIRTPLGIDSVQVWQVSYLASLSIQVAAHTTVVPSFIVQHWDIGSSSDDDHGATLAIRQQFGNIQATLIGAYINDADTLRSMVGGSLTWYPLQNIRLYSITSGGYNFLGKAPNFFLRQTIGGQPSKRGWIETSFTWGNRMISFEDIGLDFFNNSSDRLQWSWSLTPSYSITHHIGASLTYSVESRLFFMPWNRQLPDPGAPIGRDVSETYIMHSFYAGVNYTF